jgi:adenine-specific DNA-methyltransferase
MNGLSQTPQEGRIKMLQSIMPEIFDEGKIDWEKLKATLGEDINFANERYVLNWAGKGDAFRTMQQPSTATLAPCRNESVDFDNTQNIFIEGENMEVLKVLQKSYFGKIKMIYIDPPYNTGNDSFIYPDKFSESKEEYLQRVGDKDEEGYMTRDGMFRKNAKENGQYHSNWLDMMMPRLYLAKSLLREDGVIFISIDDNEVHNLRLLMNEIFGEENFITEIVWKHTQQSKNDERFFSRHYNINLVYAKETNALPDFYFKRTESDNANYSNPDNDPNGDWRSGDVRSPNPRKTLCFDIIAPNGNIIHSPENGWRWSEQSIKEKIKKGEIIFKSDFSGIIRKIYLNNQEGRTPENLWDGDSFGTTRQAAAEIKSLFKGKQIFDTPKPKQLIMKMIELMNDRESIILDFFAGSGTTAHAVMQLNKEDGGNRKFICVQLPELCDEKSEAYKAGYKTIADIAKERIRRAGNKIRKEVEAEQKKQKEELDFEDQKKITMPDLGFKVFKLSDSNFKQWKEIKGSDKQLWKEQLIEFLDSVAENASISNMVYELLLKSGKGLNSTIEHKTGYYSINGADIIMMLESATQAIADAVIAEHPHKVIALDRLFKGDDQLKTNTALQMRDAGIEFKTI